MKYVDTMTGSCKGIVQPSTETLLSFVILWQTMWTFGKYIISPFQRTSTPAGARSMEQLVSFLYKKSLTTYFSFSFTACFPNCIIVNFVFRSKKVKHFSWISISFNLKAFQPYKSLDPIKMNF